MKNYKNIHQFLKNYKKNNVIFCYGNYAIFDMAKNLIKSAQKAGVTIIFFALDKKVSDALNGICDIVNYFDKEIEQDKFYKYGDFTYEYKKLMWHCWMIGNEILRCNKSYIYLDIDIVVKKDFENSLLQQYENTDYDCLMQSEVYGTITDQGCAGFYSLRPTKRTIDLFTIDFLEKHQYLDYPGDEQFFNGVIVKNKILNIKILNRDEYPNGGYYYRNYKRINNICKIIHFCFITGYKEKINKMQAHGCWNPN